MNQNNSNLLKTFISESIKKELSGRFSDKYDVIDTGNPMMPVVMMDKKDKPEAKKTTKKILDILYGKKAKKRNYIAQMGISIDWEDDINAHY